MKIAKLLPVAVKVKKGDLPPAVLDHIRPLKSRRPWRFILEAAYCWLVVLAVVAAAVHIDHWLATTLAVLVVATRQNVLALLVHEQTHCTAFKSFPGNTITNLIAAYPLFVLTVEDYSKVHLAHHARYFTEEDPDHLRKAGEEWNYPMEPKLFGRILLGDILGLNVLKLLKGKRGSAKGATFSGKNTTPRWLRPAFYLILLTVLTVTGTWDIFLLYWMLPLLTILQVIIRWGAVCEHQYNRLGDSVQETSPLIVLKTWEKLILPNLNFTYHIYHHYFPGISFSQLPKVHRIFVEHGLVDDSAVFHGYGAYLKFLLFHEVRHSATESYARYSVE